MTTFDRRRFLQGTAAVAAGFSLAGPFEALRARTAAADPGDGRGGNSTVGYGPLRPRRAENDGVTYLALPTGFTYYAFGHVGSPMANGQPTPGAHDGMAAFPGPDGTVVLVRNHEQSNGTPFSAAAYDPGAAGGTTTIVFDPDDPANPVITPSLSGTIRNCAGGPTPWGSWLTCEETTQTGPSQPHGYVYDVPAVPGAHGFAGAVQGDGPLLPRGGGRGPRDARRLRDRGRRQHQRPLPLRRRHQDERQTGPHRRHPLHARRRREPTGQPVRAAAARRHLRRRMGARRRGRRRRPQWQLRQRPGQGRGRLPAARRRLVVPARRRRLLQQHRRRRRRRRPGVGIQARRRHPCRRWHAHADLRIARARRRC